MKVHQLVEADTIKPRPKKTLWFDDYNNWTQDIALSHPSAEAHKTEDDQILALDSEEQECYGKWDSNDQKGVTFDKPRPISSVISNRVQINKIINTKQITQYAHQ